MKRLGRVKPRGVDAGERLFLFAPCGAVREPYRRAGVQWLESAGYVVETGDSLLAAPAPFAAGSATQRLADWRGAVAQGFRAILPARGGYGGVHLLEELPGAPTADGRHLWIGSSDTTFLQTALLQAHGLVSFYGPMPCGQLAEGDEAGRVSYLEALAGRTPDRLSFPGARVLVSGAATGELRGGCLSVLAALCGTPWQPDGEDALLILEDVGEHPFRIERMLEQLRLSGVFEGARGLLFNTFPGCVDRSGDTELVETVVSAFARRLGLPAWYGLDIGHGTGARTIPLGIPAHVDGETVELLESPAL